jgi:DNA polymerase-3 subunit epsilon
LSRHRGSDVAGVDFVVVDVETTGCKAVSNRVIEVAAVRIRNGEVIDEFATLVDPDREVCNTEYHGITTADVAVRRRVGNVGGPAAQRSSARAP